MMTPSRLRVSFDIGGVLSKYPDVFQPLVQALRIAGVQVYVLTDMEDHDKAVKMVQQNEYNIPQDMILHADYKQHGENCKAVVIGQYGIDIHFDDFPGYCANTACVNLFVWPNPHLPYYADDFKTDGSEGDFGRRRPAKI